MLRGTARLEHLQAFLHLGAELTEHHRQLFQGTRQFAALQQVVARQLLQGHLHQRSGHAADLRPLLGRDLLQGQHLLQVELAHQLGNHLLGRPGQHQQGRAALAQAAVQGRQAFQQEPRSVHTQARHAEFIALEQGRIQNIDGQQLPGTQARLQGRVIIQPQILFEPEQGAHSGRL